MAKNKGMKIKQYKVPPEKFLVVINPWGVHRNFDAADFNHIGGWFEIMLRDEYPNTRIRAIYFQRTHHNIIVELPRQVIDVEHLLGTHFYSKFLTDCHSQETAYIYEYKYATFGDPSNKTFNLGHPMYDRIPPDFPIRHPYPLPSPAPPPPMEIPYARPIPPEVNEQIADRLRGDQNGPEPGPSMIAINPHSPGSPGQMNANEVPDSNIFTPYVRPAYLSSRLTERLKQTAIVEPDVKLEVDPGPAGTTTTYKPSAELLKALSSLPSSEDLIEPNNLEMEEEEKINIKLEPNHDISLLDYQPSDDLLAALATLPDNMSISSEIQVKPKCA